MSDGQVHTASIRYRPGTLSIFVDDLGTAALTVTVDLGTLLNLDSGTAFVGFTGGGAAAFENHDLLNWSFVSVPEPSSLALLAVAAVFAHRRRTVRS